MNKETLRLYLVTDRTLAGDRNLEDMVQEAVEGGVTMVQLREKSIGTRDFIALALRLKKSLAPSGIPLIINDRVDVALAADADGVHIGQSDMPYEMARRLLGPDKIIGLSVENMAEIVEANALDVDYVGISPVFATPTKTDTATPFGLEGLRKAVELSVHPTVAIGGMNETTAARVAATGVDGMAVVSAIMAAQNPKTASQRLLNLFGKTEKKPPVAKEGTWSEEVWAKASRIYQSILRQPFLREMAAGTLAVEKFDRYLAQDEIYLGNYGRSMFELAEIIPDKDDRRLLEDFAREGMESEHLMHELLIKRFGIEPALEPSVVTRLYNEHTDRMVRTGIPELGLAAILPCAWVYNEVGREVLRFARMEDNPYAEWMSEYGNEQFTEGVRQLLEVVDRLAAAATPDIRERMTSAFLEATLFEYAFWDYGYNGPDKSYRYLEDGVIG